VKSLGCVALAGAVCEETTSYVGGTATAASTPGGGVGTTNSSPVVLNVSGNSGATNGVAGGSSQQSTRGPPGVVYGFTLTPLNVDRKYEVFCESEDQADDWIQAIRLQIGKQIIEKVDSGSAREGFIRTEAVGSAKIGYLILSGHHSLLLYRQKPQSIRQATAAGVRPILDIELLGAHVRPEQDKILKGAFVFSVTPRRTKGVSTRKQFFTAETKADMDKWVTSIKAQTEVRNEEALCFTREGDCLFKNFALDDYTISTELDGAYWAYSGREEKVNFENFGMLLHNYHPPPSLLHV
jgi:hypothetical protein